MPLSPHVPDLGALDMLLSVARTGSLGRAAAEHGVSQQAASGRMARMERLVGVTLIERTAHGSALTPSGALVADWAREVVEAAAELDRGTEALRSHQRARLRIASSMTVAEYLVPAWLVTAHLEDPHVAVALEVCNSAEVVRRLSRGLVDLGFVETPSQPPATKGSPIGRDELWVVVGPSHPWARRRKPLTPAELAGTALVEREAGSGTRETLHRALRKARVDPAAVTPVIELTSTTAIKSAVASGLAPAVISSLAVADEVGHGRLVRVPTTGLDLARTLRALWPTGTTLLGPARSFAALAGRAERRRAGAAT